MTKTKYPGVYYRDAKDGTRTFYIRYSDPSGKQIRQVVGTAKENFTAKKAEVFLHETKVKQRLGQAAPIARKVDTQTLAAMAALYFEHTEAKSKSKMKSVYKSHLSYLGNDNIKSFDTAKIDTYRKNRLSVISAKTGRPYSKQTVNNALIILSAILHYAEEHKYIDSAPKVKKYTLNNTRDRYLSQEEINTLRSEIKDPKLLMFVNASLATGGRMAAILGIQGKHVNKSDGSIVLNNYKSDSTYTVYPNSQFMDSIGALDPQEYLIDVAYPELIQKPLQSILNRLFNQGLDVEDRANRLVVHSLRHTFATHLALAGTPIEKIKNVMNHKDIKMTMRYADHIKDSGRENTQSLLI